MREKFTPPFNVAIDDIKLDIKNFRYYGKLSNQRECIVAMLNDSRSKTYSAHLKRHKATEIMFFKGIQLPVYIKKMKLPYFSSNHVRDLGSCH
jgi:hypothetical protein